ncbi:transcription factor SPT20 homolog isoform X1 [Patella vulgata]|uniref:transcription factor SPT20 homolog isoform X1 n=1 Tax=Patella vulgata TaxID=6465 RepID=UPI0021805BC8|nr:transcription factor SPT20 homolog isoform X1 [Patella vulgata]
MAKGLDQIVEYAEYLLQCSKQQPSKLLKSKPGDTSSSKSKSIHQKLLDLYIEETERQPDGKELDYSTHLLAKLVKRDKLNTLILNLYPANEGYSIMVKTKNGVETETIKLPYEESDLLEYVDDAQLPPFLVDLLEKAHINVFYSGCVVIEVRDYRRSTSGSHDSQYVLLRPTSQSLLCDINTIISENSTLTHEDHFALESELLLATEEPLCLDPSPAVCLINNRVQFEEKKLCNPSLKRSVKKYTQAAVNRKRKLAQAPAPKELKLFDFITRKKEKNRNNLPVKQNLKMAKSCVDVWKQKNPVNLTAPSVLEVDKFTKILEKLPPGVEYPKVFVEEHTLEREPNQEKHMLAKITISKRSSDETYFGELYLDYEYSVNKADGGCSCQFILGCRDDVDKYLKQFEQLFTEEGRRLVKITIQKPNLPPQINYTQTPQGLNSTNISIAQAFLKQANLTATLSSQNQGESGGSNNLSVKRSMPIQLSLSIGHPLVSQANNLINQQANITLPTTIQQTQLAQQMQLIQAQANQSQKPKQTVHHTPTRIPSANKTPNDSPATTPTHQPAGFGGISITPQNPPSLQKAPTPTLTPPPNSRTPTPTSSGSGRKVNEQTTNPTTSNIPAMNLTTYIQGLVSSAPTLSTSSTQAIHAESGQNVGTNINITNIGGLPQNFNIQGLGLSGMNLANLQGLQNMQVSLTGVPSGAIAVPISMINNNPSILQNQTGLFVSSLPTLSTSTSSAEHTPVSTIPSVCQNPSSAVTTSSGVVVSIVTGLPTSSTTSAISSTTVSPQVIMSTGLTSNPTTVLPQSSSMLSLPIGLTQFMPVGSKGQASTGLRASASLPLLQLPGQQSIQHLILPQQRAQLKNPVSQGHLNVGRGQTTSGTSAVPISTVLTQSQVAALSSLKHGQATQGTITAQQFMQLTGQSGATIQQSPQHPTTQLTFQKPQQNQPLQFHHLQVKPNTTIPTQNVKPKTKKRTTPTPPK